MKAVLVRVGVDQTYGTWNAPCDPDTQGFIYVPIPETKGTRFHPNCQRPFSNLKPALHRFCQDHQLHLNDDLKIPRSLLRASMHLDPDFTTLTYGDVGDRRGSDIRQLDNGDLLVFYSGLKSIHPSDTELVYALIGLFVIKEIVNARDVPKRRWDDNAHTRKIKRGESDIIVRGQPNSSGRLTRYISIGDYRDGAYRVNRRLLQAWGGLSVKDGFIQRSARPPLFNDAKRFYRWFETQKISLIKANNPVRMTPSTASPRATTVVVVQLRRPVQNNPKESRSDPFWEFGSFGCTRCHMKNLMNPDKIDELEGTRLAFAQGGPAGVRLVLLTPPVVAMNHRICAEVKWEPIQMPFRYEKAPLLIDNAGKSDFPQLQHLIDPFDRSTWEGRFSSGFRTRRRPLRPEVAREIIRVFDQRIKHAGSDDIATQYQDAMAKPPPKIDTHRKATYRKYLAAAKSRKRQVAGSSSRC